MRALSPPGPGEAERPARERERGPGVGLGRVGRAAEQVRRGGRAAEIRARGAERDRAAAGPAVTWHHVEGDCKIKPEPCLN